jgi:hypothetical protein
VTLSVPIVNVGCHMSEQYNPASVKLSSTMKDTSRPEFSLALSALWKKAIACSPFHASSTQIQMACWALSTEVSSVGP